MKWFVFVSFTLCIAAHNAVGVHFEIDGSAYFAATDNVYSYPIAEKKCEYLGKMKIPPTKMALVTWSASEAASITAALTGNTDTRDVTFWVNGGKIVINSDGVFPSQAEKAENLEETRGFICRA